MCSSTSVTSTRTARRRSFRTNYDPVFGELASVTAPAPGNHEWEQHEQGYDRYWERERGHDPPPYYSFRAGGWDLLSVNSEEAHEPDSPQYRWLRAELGRGDGNCRLAFWHRPRYSAGLNHGDQDDMEPVWRLLRGRATLVLNGHEHDLQQLRPIDGIVELVAGAGGDGHYELDESDPRLVYGNDTDYGALRVELRPGVARFRFAAANGRSLQEGSVRCRA